MTVPQAAPGYENRWEFMRDTARLIAEGGTLRDLYDAMLAVRDPDTREIDASPQRMRWLAQSWSQHPEFACIRLAELFGELKPEHDDDYSLAMIGALGGRWEQEIRLHLLRHDAQLRDELFWRVFEVEGGGEISLANIDKFSREDLNWHRTVVLLTNEGTLDRTRVLRSCLRALNRDFSAYRAGWFSRVYAALTPTPVEAAADQDLLRLSLGSGITATVSLAVAQLAAVHRAGMLEADAFVEVCGPALSGTKSAASITVRILTALATHRSAPVDAIVEALSAALNHPHADVQRLTVLSLMKLGHEELVRAQRDALSPAVAAELLPTGSSPSPTASPERAPRRGAD
ncbi:MAG: hypothetical protein J0H64_07610, partial [Actinobacteria bacterium]|nr:hypothetical protein [Actinomycetota bacterium]